jgi:hypothetical protein
MRTQRTYGVSFANQQGRDLNEKNGPPKGDRCYENGSCRLR